MSPKALRQFTCFWPISNQLKRFCHQHMMFKDRSVSAITINECVKFWSQSGDTFYTSTLVLMRHLMGSTAQPQSSLMCFSVLTPALRSWALFNTHLPPEVSPSSLALEISAPSVRLRQVDVLCNPQLSPCVSVCMWSRWTCARQVCVVLLCRCCAA